MKSRKAKNVTPVTLCDSVAYRKTSMDLGLTRMPRLIPELHMNNPRSQFELNSKALTLATDLNVIGLSYE